MDSREKGYWKDLSPQEKKQYFMDYYLGRTLVVLAVTALLIYTAVSILRPKPSYALRIAVFDASLSEDTRQSLIHDIQKALHTAEAVEIDDSYNNNNDKDLLRIVSLSTSEKLDAVIADREVLVWLAGYGYFRDLTETFDAEFRSKNTDRLITARGLKLGENGMLEENAEGNGDWYTAGYDLSGTVLAEKLDDLRDPVIGIIAESHAGIKIQAVLEELE